jgi:RNA polymerase-binding transcription factor DksA
MNADEVRGRLDQERQRLQDIRDQVIEEEGIGEETENENVAELSGMDQHQADHASEAFERERAISLLENIEAELDDIEHALGRLDDGSYGTCEACGKPISEPRLEALPGTRFCLDDQAIVEGEARTSRQRPTR